MRRTAAGILASALALSGAVAAATPANALPGFALERIAGDNRYETSARIAAEFGVTSGAILASGETGHVVDALSANFLAGVRGVPVLLTLRDRVPASVMARLNALTGAKNVTIVGGTVAVSAAVETQLRSMGFTVTRLGGEDRYATSEEIITAGRASASPIGLVASGLSFPDALAGAPLSYKGKYPVFLTAGASIPQDSLDAMVAAGTRRVIILGGTAAVPASVEAALVARGITIVTRLGGAGRSETSRIVADYAIANFGFTNTTFNLASGAPRGEGADALSGGALSGKQNRTLLITDTVTSAAPVVAFARDRAATLNETGNIFGGPAAVAVALEEAIEAAGRTGGGSVALTATSVAQGGNLTGTITGDFSSVTVSGCGMTNQTIGADDNSTTAGRQFTLNVPSSQATGSCTLTFTSTPTGGGAAVTQTVAVNVTAGGLRVTPDDTVTLEAVANPDTVATDNRTYTAAGLTAGVEYRATLVLASNITTNGQGQSVFADADNDNLADTGTVTADITQVNGAAANNNTGAGSTSTATGGTTSTVVFTAQADGTATFVVDGDQAESVRPVVYVNGGGTATTPAQGGPSPRLELDANNVPTEAFDLGGVTIFTAPAVQSATVRPELQSAQIIGTVTTGQATPTNMAGTTVRYVFDEAINFATSPLRHFATPALGSFKLYNAAGEEFTGDDATVEAGGTSVLIRFDDVTDATGGQQAVNLTTATVAQGAVQDQTGVTNPEGDAPVGTAATGGGGTALPAGITTAPDLLNVTNFRQASGTSTTAVDFVFDEAAFVIGGGAFTLVRQDGSEIVGTAAAFDSTTAGGGTVAGGNGTTTFTVIFTNPTGQTTPITEAQVARATVDEDTVSDARQADANPLTAATGNGNPLQADEVTGNGATIAPDLVSVSFQPAGNTNDDDRALFTFDQTVSDTVFGSFSLYQQDADSVAGTAADINPSDARQVLVSFPNGTIADSVGGNVLDGAVTSVTGVANVNDQDERGVAGTAAAGTARTPGRTAGPDLTGVALSRGTDQFGNQTDFRAVYTFDEDIDTEAERVDALVDSAFRLVAADGTVYVATNCAVTAPTGTQTADDVDNTVTCTEYNVGAAADAADATSAQIGNVTLGTVAADAVNEDIGDEGNPEGAEMTTGGTGTRA